MKELNRKSIQRMVGNTRAGSGGGGGSSFDPSYLAGFATEAFVEENYVSKLFWNEIFEVRGTKTTTVGSGEPVVIDNYLFAPNEIPGTTTTTEGDVTTTVVTVITNIRVKAGVWTDSYMSALGLSSGGGGGGASTLGDLLDVNLTSPQPGQLLQLNNNGFWVNQSVETVMSGYLPLTGGTLTGAIKVTGRYAGSGDDEGIVIGPASNGYAGLCLGIPTGVRSVFYLNGQDAFWRYSDGTNIYDIHHPQKAGTIALTSDLSDYLLASTAASTYLPLTGGTMTGTINFKMVNASNYIKAIQWIRHNDDSDIAAIGYENDRQRITLNPIGASDQWSDAIGKYNLVIGPNVLRYNTWDIIHSNNIGQQSVANAINASNATNAYNLLTNNTSQAADACFSEDAGLHFYRYNGNDSATGGDGFILQWCWGTGSVGQQLYIDDNPNGTMMIRGRNYNATYTQWWKVYTDAYHPEAGNADTLDGFHATISDTPFGTIPAIATGGCMNVGNSFEMHYDNTTASDYSTRLYCTGNYSNSLALPSESGTLATREWIDGNYISISFFETLFNALNSSGYKVSANNTTGIASIKAMFGFWTDQYLSALGLSSGGGGGGTTLNEPLASINSAGLGTHPLSANQAIVWNGSAWVYGSTGGVTSVNLSMPTGFQVSGNPITTSGAFLVSFASGYSLPTDAKQTNWDTAYSWGNHASAGYLLASTAASTYLPFAGGKLTGNLQLGTSGTSSDDSADILWLYGNGSEKARIWLPDTPTTAAGPTYRLYNSSGTLLVQDQIALLSDNVASASKLADNSAYTAWGLTFFTSGTPRTISGDMSNVGNISFAASGKNIGGLLYFDTTHSRIGIGTSSPSYPFHVASNSYIAGTLTCSSNISTSTTINAGGTITAVDNITSSYGNIVSSLGDVVATVGDVVAQAGNLLTGTANGKYVQIGQVRLIYDSSNNAIKVQKADGSAANFYATGAVSALGLSGGSGSADVDTLTVNTLRIGSSYDTITASSGMHISSASAIYLGAQTVYLNNNTYADGNGYLHTGRLYLSSNVYIYTDGSNAKIVIGSNTYTLTKQ